MDSWIRPNWYCFMKNFVLYRPLAQTRTVHLVQALHIFKYLDQHKKNEINFDMVYHNVEDPALVQAWMKAMREMYPYVVEYMPPNSPLPWGNTVEVTYFVDSDHARDKVTRRSQMGILLYLNSAPIIWYSKRQNIVERSTFCSEFVALQLPSELIIFLRYKFANVQYTSTCSLNGILW